MNEADDRRRTLQTIVVCAAAVTLLAAIYVSSYLALSEPLAVYDGSATFAGRVQNFRMGGKSAEVIFWPLTQIDVLVRLEYWRSP